MINIMQYMLSSGSLLKVFYLQMYSENGIVNGYYTLDLTEAVMLLMIMAAIKHI